MNWVWRTYAQLSKEELYEILRCRQEVFAVEQNVVYQDCDELDQHSWHLFRVSKEQHIEAYLRVVGPSNTDVFLHLFTQLIAFCLLNIYNIMSNKGDNDGDHN